jgi:hypothetical protein
MRPSLSRIASAFGPNILPHAERFSFVRVLNLVFMLFQMPTRASTRRSYSSASVLFICVVLLLSGCSKPLNLQIVLEDDTNVTAGMPVYVDTLPAGKVVSVGEEGGEQVANLSIRAAPAKERLREGAIYIPDAERVRISTRKVEPGAPPLVNGARIPTKSGVIDFVMKYSKGSTLAAIGVTAAILLGLFLFFRSLVGAIGLIISVAVAGIVTHAVYSYAVPWVTQLYARLPDPSIAQAAAGPTPSPIPSGSDSTASKFVNRATKTIEEIMVMRPDPKVLTWCLVFVGLFIIVNLVLGRAGRAWKT